MKLLLWIGGAVLVLVIAVFVLQLVASERVEVVELRTVDEAGEASVTRLWIVDHEGQQYLRAGGTESGWAARALGGDRVRLTRGETTRDYRAVPRPEMRDAVNDRMRAKYTWGDAFISVLVGSRENALPIELQPI